jgi:predicted DCC family thiol-disulfide oxidoreductase YuxK
VRLLPHFVVLFDGACPLCRRAVRVLRRLDWFGRLTFADATDDALRNRYAPGLDRAAALTEMYVVNAAGVRTAGFDGYLQLARGLPILWVPRWLGLLPPVTWLGRWIYRMVAARRVRQGGCTDEICAPGAARPL